MDEMYELEDALQVRCVLSESNANQDLLVIVLIDHLLGTRPASTRTRHLLQRRAAVRTSGLVCMCSYCQSRGVKGDGADLVTGDGRVGRRVGHASDSDSDDSDKGDRKSSDESESDASSSSVEMHVKLAAITISDKDAADDSDEPPEIPGSPLAAQVRAWLEPQVLHDGHGGLRQLHTHVFVWTIGAAVGRSSVSPPSIGQEGRRQE